MLTMAGERHGFPEGRAVAGGFGDEPRSQRVRLEVPLEGGELGRCAVST